ncbi:MAG: hypothetical protein J1E63_08110 [Muribaculaceae bacterium]|nr:hypothetical protein [Muribaculaceae bacterium]
MALINAFKRALGFGVAEEEEEYEALTADARKTGIATPPFHEPEPELTAPDPVPVGGEPVVDPTSRVVDTLLELMRNSMSSPRFRAEIGRLMSTAPADDHHGEQSRARAEIDALRAKADRADALEEELKQTRLSAQRQQRAYTDRINELMGQINAGHAPAQEPEQPDPLIADLQQQLTSREKTICDMRDTIKAMEAKAKVSDGMINALNARASQARSELKESAARWDDERQQLEMRLDRALAEVDNLNGRLAAIAAERAEAAEKEENTTTTAPSTKRRGRSRKQAPTPDVSTDELASAEWIVGEPAEDGMPAPIRRRADSESKSRNNQDDNNPQMSLW